jgi:hypothetical protein
MISTIDSLKLTKLPHHFEANGDLIVMERSINIPFNIARVFVVRAPQGAVRGEHAHRVCSQFLTCPNGIVEVICDDGVKTQTFMLDHPNTGLLIPAGIWSEQTYKTYGAVLTVLCDRLYEAEDYIRDYDEFKRFRMENSGMENRI